MVGGIISVIVWRKRLILVVVNAIIGVPFDETVVKVSITFFSILSVVRRLNYSSVQRSSFCNICHPEYGFFEVIASAAHGSILDKFVMYIACATNQVRRSTIAVMRKDLTVEAEHRWPNCLRTMFRREIRCDEHRVVVWLVVITVNVTAWASGCHVRGLSVWVLCGAGHFTT